MSSLRTPLLDIDYDETGPRDASVVLLPHGWPDDRASWGDVLSRCLTSAIHPA